jgi:hypothetical protein
VLDLRRKKYEAQMNRINRRNAERGIQPQETGARPPAPGSRSRRGSLSSDQ